MRNCQNCSLTINEADSICGSCGFAQNQNAHFNNQQNFNNNQQAQNWNNQQFTDPNKNNQGWNNNQQFNNQQNWNNQQEFGGQFGNFNQQQQQQQQGGWNNNQGGHFGVDPQQQQQQFEKESRQGVRAGIIALVVSAIGWIILGVALGIVGISMSINALRLGRKTNNNTAIVLGILGLIHSIIVVIATFVAIIAFNAALI
ncbi:MAG: hypothetical protein FWB72_07050 [Firmicutes bacterium]|nr:hypothetical protein [Bacillota bacterium]